MSNVIERDFETGDFEGFIKTGSANWPEIVEDPVRQGRFAMKTYVNRTTGSGKNYRTSVIPAVDGKQIRFTHHEEFWLGISIMVPTDFVIDMEEEGEILFQFHHSPDDWDNPGECRQPMFTLGIEKDRWMGIVRGIGSEKRFDLGSLRQGQWIDWTIQAVISKGDDGIARIWKGDDLRMDHLGSTTKCEFIKSPYLLFGLYKWSWKDKHNQQYWTSVVDRTYYHDEFRIGKTFEEVQPEPGGGTVPEPNPDPPPIGEIMPVLADLQAIETSLRQLADDVTAQADAIAQAIIDLEAVDDILDAAADVIAED